MTPDTRVKIRDAMGHEPREQPIRAHTRIRFPVGTIAALWGHGDYTAHRELAARIAGSATKDGDWWVMDGTERDVRRLVAALRATTGAVIVGRCPLWVTITPASRHDAIEG